ncbi:hypothetical protein KY343_01525 [Candidatus Woesearchaeota archaeon]|nr:hypothetical protein [Candidatus Woesearchaeota archaeon]
MEYTDMFLDRIRDELSLHEYSEDEAAKKRLMQSNESFRKVVELYEKTLEKEEAEGTPPFRKPGSEKIKGIIDLFAELNRFDLSEYDKDPELAETVHKELAEISQNWLGGFRISNETGDYLANHPEIKLYRAKGKVTAFYKGGSKSEVHGVEHLLFEKDEKRIRHRIDLGYKIESMVYDESNPVRTMRFDISELEEVRLDELD